MWFELRDKEDRAVASDGEVFFEIYDGEELVHTSKHLQVKASEFKNSEVGLGAFKREVLLYAARVDTEYIGWEYDVYVIFLRPDGMTLKGNMNC